MSLNLNNNLNVIELPFENLSFVTPPRTKIIPITPTAPRKYNRKYNRNN